MILRIPVVRLMVAGLFAAGLLLPARAPGESGNVNWQDHFDRAGAFDSALAVVWAHGLIVVAGQSANAAGNQDWSVFAYDR